MNQNFKKFIGFTFSTLVIPVIMVIVACIYMNDLGKSVSLSKFEAESFNILETMRYVTDTEKYLCNRINDLFIHNLEADNFKRNFDEFLASHDIQCRYFIWNAEGKILSSNFAVDFPRENLVNGFVDLLGIKEKGLYSQKISEKSERGLREIFGPHFFPANFIDCFAGQERSLLRPDARQNADLLWLNVRQENAVAVFLKAETIKSDAGLKTFIKTMDRSFVSGYLDGETVFAFDADAAGAVERIKKQIASSFSNSFSSTGFRILTNFLGNQKIGFCAISEKKIGKTDFPFLFHFILFIAFSVSIIFLIVSYRSIMLGREISLKLTWRLLILFLVSNLLPGLVMVVVGSDYLYQMHESMTLDVFNQGSRFLHKIDELFINEFTAQKKALEKTLPALVSDLKHGKIDKSSIHDFLGKQSPEPFSFLLVASESNIAIGTRGVLKEGEVFASFDEKFAQDTIILGRMRALQKVCFFIISVLGKKNVPAKIETEVEFIGEGLFQRKPYELVQLFYAADSFWEWTFGPRSLPLYVEMFRIFDPELVDYMMLYIWNSYYLQLNFFERLHGSINRNEAGFEIIAVDERIERSFPPNALFIPEVREMAYKLRDRTFSRPDYLRIENKDYLVAGHKCLKMDKLRLLALFPVDRIERAVAAKRGMLLSFVSISILISIFLGLFLSGSILNPLVHLQKGISALNHRDFSHRVPELGKNEFGHLAEIFNETLIDLEEMHVAGIVQERILSGMSQPLKTGDLRFFGKTFLRSGIGGDYFEVLETVSGHKSVLIGDVSGGGISNCLILAYIKSAVMQLHRFTDDSVDFLKRLNDLLIEGSKMSRSKSFSCQFIILNQNGDVNVANAGLPHPVLVDHEKRTVRSVRISSLPLGKTARHTSETISVKLRKGQSLVCFTSGFLGHWRFDYGTILELIRDSISDDIEEFISNCELRLNQIFKKHEISEDCSIIIIQSEVT
ncbi:MAG: PP2C family protein-serine/threonine phosphatase [Candidatus Rifleibacteriota bacterium]